MVKKIFLLIVLFCLPLNAVFADSDGDKIIHQVKITNNLSIDFMTEWWSDTQQFVNMQTFDAKTKLYTNIDVHYLYNNVGEVVAFGYEWYRGPKRKRYQKYLAFCYGKTFSVFDDEKKQFMNMQKVAGKKLWFDTKEANIKITDNLVRGVLAAKQNIIDVAKHFRPYTGIEPDEQLSDETQNAIIGFFNGTNNVSQKRRPNRRL